jgi:hypothetical protein
MINSNKKSAIHQNHQNEPSTLPPSLQAPVSIFRVLPSH